jgi:hypothetical protein
MGPQTGYVRMSNEIAITNDVLAIRGIDEVTWSALKNSIYPGAKDESVMMAVDYCRARQLDPLLKPVHLVPMSVHAGCCAVLCLISWSYITFNNVR